MSGEQFTLRVFIGILLALPLAAQDQTAGQDRLARPARVGVGVTQRELTLQEAVEQALKSNLDIEIERTNIDNAQQAVKAAKGVFDTTFRYQPLGQQLNTPTGSILQGASGKLTDTYFNNNFYIRQRLERSGTAFGLDFINSRQTTTNPFTSFSPLLNSGLTLSVTQPLLRNRETDRDRTEVRVRRKNVDISEVDFELRVIDIVSRVEQAYWNLVGARQDERVQAEAVGLARQQLEINQRLIRSGTLAPVELAASEAELQRRLDTYYTSLEAITRAENTLKTLISSNRDEPLWSDEVIPTESQPLQPPAFDDLREAVAQALRRRPELKRVRLQTESNQVQREYAENQRKPQVDLVGSYTLNGLGGTVLQATNPFTASNTALYTQLNLLAQAAGIPILPPPSNAGPPGFLVGSYGTTLGNLFSGRYQSYTAGINIDMNLRNRTANALATQAAIQDKRLRLQQSQAEQQIQAELRNSLQELESSKQRIAAAEAGVRAAKEKLDSESRLFQNGESTNFFVLTRQNEFADARRRLVAAHLDLNRAVARLEQASGTTLETHKVVLRK